MRSLFFILFCLLGVSLYASSWELEKNEDGIKVYTRAVSGTDVKEFKVNCTMNASRLAIAKIVSRASDFMNWIPNVEDSRILEIVSPTKRIVYYEVDCPWPISNRDIVMDFWVEADKEKDVTYIKFKENLTAKPEVDGLVRMKKSEGFWKLTSLSDNKTRVDYQFSGDPGGGLPAWLINMFIVDTPFETFEVLREMVE